MRNRIIKGVAGAFVLTGLILGLTVHQNWFFLTGFVGINLFQTAFSRWCLLDDILKSIKVKG